MNAARPQRGLDAFPTRRSADLIGRTWIGQMLVLAHQRRRRHLSDHQARVQPRFGREKRWKVEGERGIDHQRHATLDRKSTRLNSSHVRISYAVFCLKQKRAPAL